MVVQIQSDGDPPHLVALARGSSFAPAFSPFRFADTLILLAVSSEEATPGGSWHLFNDFLVKPISEDEALSFPGSWKVGRESSHRNLKAY